MQAKTFKKVLPIILIGSIFVAWVYAATVGPSSIYSFDWLNASSISVDEVWVGGQNVTDNVFSGSNAITVEKNNVEVGSGTRLDFQEGSNTTLTITDSGDEIDIVISASAIGPSNDLSIYHAVISTNSSNAGRPRYYICDGEDDQVQINQAFGDMVGSYPEVDRVQILIEAGNYSISNYIAVHDLYPKMATVWAYGVLIRIEAGRPNGGADAPYHYAIYNIDHPLIGFRWFGGEIDGNKVNNPVGDINTGGALVYFDYGGNDLIIRDMYVHNTTMRGMMTKARSSDWYNVYYLNCKAWHCNIDGLKFAMSSGGDYKEFYASAMMGCEIGGDIGDIGFNFFDQNDVGSFHDNAILDCIAYRMTGHEGTGAARWAIKIEATSWNNLIDGFVIYDADKGIGIDDSGSDEQYKGRNVVSNGIIYMSDNSTGNVVAGPSALVIKSDYNTINNVHIIGALTAGESLIILDDGADYNLLSSIYLINGTKGIEIVEGVYNRITGGYSFGSSNCGIELKAAADRTRISCWTFADAKGLEIDANSDYNSVIDCDFDLCTVDLTDAGNNNVFAQNWNSAGTYVASGEP